MSEIHLELGEIVYQSEIQKIRPRSDIHAKITELIIRYGADIKPMLMDIYDEIVDNPDDWAYSYSAK